MTQRYAAFISYRHLPRDRKWAMEIMQRLEAYRVPKALQREGYPDKLGTLFRDEDEIPASSDLSDQIKQALEVSDNLIVICSPDTPQSQWVRREIELFQEMGRSERILPVLIAGEPEESFPPELFRRKITKPGKGGKVKESWEEIEPIAADIRPRKDEKPAKTQKRAVLRLAATLLGCRFDDLAQREAERAKAQARKIFAGAIAAALCLAVIGTWWWDANLRIKTQHYAAFGSQWAAPFGVGALKGDDWQQRYRSYRFEIQAGKVLQMTRINGSGSPVNDFEISYQGEAWNKGVARWMYDYSEDGRVDQVKMLSATGREIRTISYDFDGQEGLARFDKGLGNADRQAAAATAIGAIGAGTGTSRSQIGQHRLNFDQRGWITTRLLEPVGGGTTVADANGAYGRAYIYTDNGLVRRISNLDAELNPLIEKVGTVSIQFAYDHKGDLTAVEWLGENAVPVENDQGFQKSPLSATCKTTMLQR